MQNSSLLIRFMTGEGATAKAEGENATYSGGWQWMTFRQVTTGGAVFPSRCHNTGAYGSEPKLPGCVRIQGPE